MEMAKETELLEIYRREMLFIRLLLVPYFLEFESDPEWADFCILTIYVWEARHFDGYILRIHPKVPGHDQLGYEHSWVAIDRQNGLLCYLKTGKMVQVEDLPEFRGVSKKWIESPEEVKVTDKVIVSRRYGKLRKYILQEWKWYLLFQDTGIITYGTHFWRVQPVEWELSQDEIEFWINAGYYDAKNELVDELEQYQQIFEKDSEPFDEPEWMLRFRSQWSAKAAALYLSRYPSMALLEKRWWERSEIAEQKRAEELQKEIRWCERLRATYGAQLFDEVEREILAEYQRIWG